MKFFYVDNAEIVKILIKSGAHVDALNSEGNSAFTVATDSGSSEKLIPIVFESRVEKTHSSNYIWFSGSFEVANLLKDATSESDNRRDCNALHEAVIKSMMKKNCPNHVELISIRKLFIIPFR